MTAPTPHIILMGASNLTRAISTVTQVARGLCGSPADFTIACGHGRSYGQRSRLFGRSLPGILECGMWSALESVSEESETPVYALITDIGNDIVYGVRTERLMGWIEACIERLRGLNARIVITELPEDSIDRVTPRRYEIVRRLFFARHHTPYEQVMTTSREMAAGIRELAGQPNISIAPQQGAWYGMDPIHIKYGCWCNAWTSILSHWRDEPPTDDRSLAHASVFQWTYLRTRTPQSRGWFSWEQRGSQPCGRLRDGSSISMY